MFRLSRSYFLSVMLTAIMTTCVCAQSLLEEENERGLAEVGDSLPRFDLTSTQHESIELYDYLADEPILLIYYRGGW